MRKFKYLLVLLLLFVPFVVFADEEETTEATDDASKEVTVYFFRGEGCPHCQDAEDWFSSIEEEHGSKFNIVDYETWNDTDNAELMQRVAEARNETAEGVPYIIVGNKSWNGFTESYGEEILAEINSEYEKDPSTRYDVMKLLKDKKVEKPNDVLALIIILVIVAAIGFGIYRARKSTY